MNEKKNFTVTPLPFLFYIGLAAIGMAIILIMIGIITSEPLYSIPASFELFGALMGITYQKRVKITVNDHTITVRRWIGKKYRFDVSQIVKVNWRTVQNRNGINEVIRIKTATRRRRVEIGTMMIGSEDMKAYLLENVDSSKINRTYWTLDTTEDNQGIL